MECKKCGKETEKSWRFCPYCGLSLRKKLFGFNLNPFKILKTFEHAFESDLNKMFSGSSDNIIKSGGISIKIDSTTGEPRIEVKRLGEKENTNVKNEKKQIHNLGSSRAIPQKASTKEPASRMFKQGSNLIIEVELPGIKSMQDIAINEFEESLEVRAYGTDEIYFKILQIPEEHSVSKSYFINEKLNIVLSQN
ncbi:MAG: zinc ribbon domain-containing protein [Candidatus Nanoarchaeia archaeon]|nr:zinc ribbon domain-containing protein [Candidatus Nanoarchaeia archaeon]